MTDFTQTDKKWYVATLWDATEENIINLIDCQKLSEQRFNEGVRKGYINFINFQLEECPTTKKLHLQLYVQYNQNIGFKNLFTKHLNQKLGTFNAMEQRANTAQAASEYASWEFYPNDSKHSYYNTKNKKTNLERLVLMGTRKRKHGTDAYSSGCMSTQGKRRDISTFKRDIDNGCNIDYVWNNYPETFLKYEKCIKALIYKRDAKKIKKQILKKENQILEKSYFYQSKIMKILDTTPDTKTIHIVTDYSLKMYSGELGKSTLRRKLNTDPKYNAFFATCGKVTDLVHAMKNHIVDNGQFNVVIFDLERQYKKYLNLGFLNDIKGQIMSALKYNSNTLYIKPVHVIVFCNFMPIFYDIENDQPTVTLSRIKLHSIYPLQYIQPNNINNKFNNIEAYKKIVLKEMTEETEINNYDMETISVYKQYERQLKQSKSSHNENLLGD